MNLHLSVTDWLNLAHHFMTLSLLSVGGAITGGAHLEAGWGIKAGECIHAQGAIKAGESLCAGGEICAGPGYGVFAGLHVQQETWEASAQVWSRERPEGLRSGVWLGPSAV